MGNRKQQGSASVARGCPLILKNQLDKKGLHVGRNCVEWRQIKISIGLGMKKLLLCALVCLHMGTGHAGKEVYRYLQTMADNGLLDVMTSKAFLSPLARRLGVLPDLDREGGTREEILQDLMANPIYRAYTAGYMLLEKDRQQLEQREDFADKLALFFARMDADSIVQIPLLLAVDGNMDFDTLRVIRYALVQNNALDTPSFSDIPTAIAMAMPEGKEPIVLHQTFFAHHGHYLMRMNHVVHPPLSAQHKQKLEQLGYRAKQIALLPAQVANELIQGELTPKILASSTNGLDLAMLVDLMLEPGVFGNIVPSLLQLARLSRERKPLKHLLGRELLLDPTDDGFDARFTEVLAVLNADKRPASLFQVVQLRKLGFSLAEIRDMSWYAREAIIIANPVDKTDFEEQYGLTSTPKINTFVEMSGPTVFFLLGIGLPLAVINPHLLKYYNTVIPFALAVD